MRKEDLSDTDPRKFYFVTLERLRVAQSDVPQATHVGEEGNCDPEAGLYLEEELYRRQLGKNGDVKRLLSLMSDIERLQTFYDLSRNLLIKGIADVRDARSSGDEPSPPRQFNTYIATSGAAIKSIYETVSSYVDREFPSDGSLEKLVRRDYSARK